MRQHLIEKDKLSKSDKTSIKDREDIGYAHVKYLRASEVEDFLGWLRTM